MIGDFFVSSYIERNVETPIPETTENVYLHWNTFKQLQSSFVFVFALSLK